MKAKELTKVTSIRLAPRLHKLATAHAKKCYGGSFGEMVRMLVWADMGRKSK